MANDFSADERCKALWKFESGALTTDSEGTNTLVASASPPTADTTNYREGAASALFTSADSQCYSIADASLDSGFPWKNGESNLDGSFCFWAKRGSGGSVQRLLIKHADATHCICMEYYAGGYLRWIGSNTGYDIWQIAPFPTGWCHIAVVIDSTNLLMRCRIYSVSDGIARTYTHVLPLAIPAINAPWVIGSSGAADFFDGNIDEFIVFNGLLTDIEIDLIRQGTFTAEHGIYTISTHIFDMNRVVSSVGAHILELQKSIAGMSTFILERTFRNYGMRTYPLPNAKTVWQSQTGKRKFPMPGEQEE